MRAYLRGTVLLLVTCVVASSCAADVQSGGPLSLGAESLEWCTPGSEGGARHTLADRRMQLDGSEQVTIRAVNLVDARNLELLDAVLVPSEGRGLIGARRNWPPDHGPGQGELPDTWSERISAIGASVEPGSEWNMALGLESKSVEAGAKSVVIRYEDGSGDQFEVEYPTKIEVKAACG